MDSVFPSVTFLSTQRGRKRIECADPSKKTPAESDSFLNLRQALRKRFQRLGGSAFVAQVCLILIDQGDGAKHPWLRLLKQSQNRLGLCDELLSMKRNDRFPSGNRPQFLP